MLGQGDTASSTDMSLGSLAEQWTRPPFGPQCGHGEAIESLPPIGAYPGFGVVVKFCYRGDMDGRRVVQRLVNGETALEIARSFGYKSPSPVMDAA